MSIQGAQGGTSPHESAQFEPEVNAHAFGAGDRLRPRTKVLPEQARNHNRALVLGLLYHQGAMSRADLSRETHLTRVTISDMVGELIDEGIVIETGYGVLDGPGKPPIIVDIDREGHQIIGLDLSSSNELIGAVINMDGVILARASVERPSRDDPEGGYRAVLDLARQLIGLATVPILGVGVGTPGIVGAGGVVHVAPNFGWTDMPLQARLKDELALPVLVANDANAAILADYTFGGASSDSILVKVGRGVGAGLLAGGQPMRGNHYSAGEIGHVVVGTDGGPQCPCGKIGCLEAWLAVPSLEARIAAAGEDGRERILRDAGERLGIALAPVVAALDISEIILSGPTELLGGALAEATITTLRSRILAQFHENIRVRMTAQGDDIILRGAAVMVLSGLLGVS